MRSAWTIVALSILLAVFLAWRDLRYRPESTDSVEPTKGSPAQDPVVVGAGDIASCDNDHDEATAKLLDEIEGTVFTLGDNVYPGGAISDLKNCYEPTWGRHKARTKPAAGNHDYFIPQAEDYFAYFGDAAGDRREGFYSYNLGRWHIVVLNSNCGQIGGCGQHSPQVQWLRKDLAAHPATCTLAYMHHPRFSSGARHGSDQTLQTLWQTLHENGVDVVLAGHDHTYERFKPMGLNGQEDLQSGVREFVVGTGGRSHYNFGPPLSTSEVRDNTSYGVLKLTLRDSSYDWEFVPVEGAAFRDSGTGACH